MYDICLISVSYSTLYSEYYRIIHGCIPVLGGLDHCLIASFSSWRFLFRVSSISPVLDSASLGWRSKSHFALNLVPRPLSLILDTSVIISRSHLSKGGRLYF